MNVTQRRALVYAHSSFSQRALCSRAGFAALLAGTVMLTGSLASRVQADTLEPSTATTTTHPAASLPTPEIAANPGRATNAFLNNDAPNISREANVSQDTLAQKDLLANVEAHSLDARLAKWGMKSDFSVESVMRRHGFRSAAECQAALVPRPFPIALRLGAALSPRLRFAGGADITFPSLSIGKGFSTRVDADAIVSANFGGITTLVPVTINQVYRFSLPGGAGLYVGGGIGPYFGEVTRFGGKLFIGGEITPRFGLEGTLHFQGYGDPITTVQARFPF